MKTETDHVSVRIHIESTITKKKAFISFRSKLQLAYRLKTHFCQQSRMIFATKGSTSFGISSRRSWKPTAPTTCIGFIPCHGFLNVASSHKMTPKLYTSHLKTQEMNVLLATFCRFCSNKKERERGLGSPEAQSLREKDFNQSSHYERITR
jgi:hypothetical protein